MGARQLLQFSSADPESWEHLVGLYFQASGRSPTDVGLPTLLRCRNLRMVDLAEKDPAAAGCWLLPANGTLCSHLAGQIGGIQELAFEEAVRRWACNGGQAVSRVLERAGWMLSPETTAAWRVMDDIKRMKDGVEKDKLVAEALRESPQFAQACLADKNCGL